MFHAELIGINRKDITIERTRGVTWIAFQQADAFDLTQRLIHVCRHLFSLFGLRREAFNADECQRRCDLTQPEVASHLKFLSVILSPAAQRMWTSTVNDAGSLRSEIMRFT